MERAQKSRVAQFTKTVLDLGWYMGLVVGVLYVVGLIVSALIKNYLLLNTIYMLSGLRIGFTLKEMLADTELLEFAGNEVMVLRGAFIPFWVENGGIVMWLGVLASVIQFGLALYLLFVLRRFVQTIIHRTPFILQNRVRLRNMGISIIGSFVSLFTVALIHERKFLSSAHEESIKLLGADSFELMTSELTVAPLWMLIAGLLCLVFAEAFRYGRDLQVEQDLTV